jgi:threonine dehydratase
MKPLLEVLRPTTIIESQKLKDRFGLDVVIASETFQHTGSFKFRAAYNVALNVPNERILTASSGNFGQALAYACRLLNKHCTVIMPATSARVKVDAVRDYGANVDLIDTAAMSRAGRLDQLAAEMPDAYIASPYDDRLVIEGNASLGDEIASMGLDAVIAPVGGGGLLSGLVTSFARSGKKVEIIGAEPLLGNDAARSLAAGKIVSIETEPATLADGARTLALGKLNWDIVRNGVSRIIEVGEEAIAEAVKIYFALANLKCEPTAALPLGAVLTESSGLAGRRVGLIVSGGNVDTSVYARIIAG